MKKFLFLALLLSFCLPLKAGEGIYSKDSRLSYIQRLLDLRKSISKDLKDDLDNQIKMQIWPVCRSFKSAARIGCISEMTNSICGENEAADESCRLYLDSALAFKIKERTLLSRKEDRSFRKMKLQKARAERAALITLKAKAIKAEFNKAEFSCENNDRCLLKKIDWFCLDKVKQKKMNYPFCIATLGR